MPALSHRDAMSLSHAAVRPARRHTRAAVVLLLLAVALAGAWLGRAAVLARVGEALVVEDAPRDVDVVVVSIAEVRAGALEAARLYREGRAKRVVVSRWREEPVDATIRALGVSHPLPHELATAILERSGVPARAISVPAAAVDGTESEVAAVARLARVERPGRILLLTARSHSARARWLLDRALRDGDHVAVRSAPADGFQPRAWWTSREQTRELVMEYVRWLHGLLARGT